MRFAEALPYLEAGRVCEAAEELPFPARYRLHDGDLQICDKGMWRTTLNSVGSLMRLSWSIVEEPAPAKPAIGCSCCNHGGLCGLQCCARQAELRGKLNEALFEANVLRLRDLAHSSVVDDLRATIARLTREREACMCVSSDAPGARCLMPSGHPGKIHSNGKQAWLC